MDYGEFAAEFDEVLNAVLATDTVLELNTRRLNSRKVYQEMLTVYRRYRQLGGRCVTIGSDAHKAEDLGKNFAAAQELIRAVGLTAATFCERELVVLQ